MDYLKISVEKRLEALKKIESGINIYQDTVNQITRSRRALRWPLIFLPGILVLCGGCAEDQLRGMNMVEVEQQQPRG